MTSPAACQLKPCPFCGGSASLLDLEHDTAGTYWIAACNNNSCAYEGHFDKPTREEAIDAWNTRAPEGEAVAWQYRYREEGFDWTNITKSVADEMRGIDFYEVRPLYTPPRAAPTEAEKLRALIGKWRGYANRVNLGTESEFLNGVANGVEGCADELEAALAKM